MSVRWVSGMGEAIGLLLAGSAMVVFAMSSWLSSRSSRSVCARSCSSVDGTVKSSCLAPRIPRDEAGDVRGDECCGEELTTCTSDAVRSGIGLCRWSDNTLSVEWAV